MLTGSLRRWRPQTRSAIGAVRTHWRTIAVHCLLWWLGVLGAIASFVVVYVGFYRWYIPAERLSQPIFLQYDGSDSSYCNSEVKLTAHSGVTYDVSLQLLIPDLASLSESLGNIMIKTELISGDKKEQSSRPTLLIYRSRPVRLALLALRLVPVVLGLTREATAHRVFLLERIALPDNEVNIKLSLDHRVPVYEATLEMVAHFTGLRYVMYYWRWAFAIAVIGAASLGAIIILTLALSTSLYLKVAPPESEGDSEGRSSGLMNGVHSTPSSSTSEDVMNGIHSTPSSTPTKSLSDERPGLRRRCFKNREREREVPNGSEPDTEDEDDL